MSRDLGLEDLILEGRPDREHYVPGKESRYYELIELLVTHYYTPRTKSKFPTLPPELHEKGDAYCIKELISQHRDEDFNPHNFIDEFILTAGARVGARLDTGLILSPLINALYMLDYNDFVFDFASWSLDNKILCMGYELKGEEGNPLRVAFKNINTTELGTGAEWCEIIHYGNAGEVGHSNENCTFTVHGITDITFIAGEITRGCNFYLSNIYSRYCGDGEQEWGPVESEEEIQRYFGEQKLAFSVTGNHLYIPDKDGEWKEVDL